VRSQHFPFLLAAVASVVARATQRQTPLEEKGVAADVEASDAVGKLVVLT
jgi:hypothetical protein